MVDEIKDLLTAEMREQELQNLKENEINWLSSDFYKENTWDKIKGHSKNLWEHKERYMFSKEGKLVSKKWKRFFLAYAGDTIEGKPQLIEPIQKRIPLVRLAIKSIKEKMKGENPLEEVFDIQSFYFFDEKFDKRHDGFQQDCFALDFYIYRIISDDNKEYFIYTQTKLPNCRCRFKGMLVELDDFAELSRSLKIKSVSKIFFMKEFEPDIKILSPELLVNYTKERQITEQDWFDFLGFHPFGTINKFPLETEYLKSAGLLSSKVDEYPLHLSFIGFAGTKKSKGLIEATAYKFGEDFPIYEGGNSRLKGLAPSFKEKPANLGYLAKAERIGFIDEIGKMVEQRMNQDNLSGTSLLGELNFLLDHSTRLVGSGNDNDIKIQATGKFWFVSNPVKTKSSIYNHVNGVYNPEFMSRVLWWVQDEEERKFLLSSESVLKTSDNTETSLSYIENRKKDILLKKCYRKISSNSEFITLYDTCNSFLSVIDDQKVRELSQSITFLAKEPMKSVWEPRGEHHTKLIIDGLVKHRCLFRDYDSSFTANQQDYDIAERILIRMVKSWDTDLSPKQEGFR